ncbi:MULTISPECIES: GNAT family N-acetyltransferase [unclassified Brevundimonas]|uniref:GNAT family N-acetyltransferase n=1 Tax=unclassified Brevundimonas TaxID=2622653 RepID=UPI0025C43487|nr:MULTISPECIES: GNAT family N-acetyltransferase [unclassified Brevundimonas]
MVLQQVGTEQAVPALKWRAMTEADLDGVVEVAKVSFPDHPEDRVCFANRLELNPSGCFVLSDEAGHVSGYLVAYPWKRNAAPALNVLIDALPDDAETLYLHDLALHPSTRGGGYTRPVIEALAASARENGYGVVSLVAVNNASGFWARNGFEIQSPPGMAEKLASYGEDARYMERSLV